MPIEQSAPRKVLVTGSAGFIGFHLSQLLLDEGFAVVGYDGMTDYYDVRIKERRHQMLLQNQHFSAHVGMLEDFDRLHQLCMAEQPDVIVHLAAQAGVRYSLENPRAYIDANIIGTFNVMECARELAVDHLLMASTSSVYGANEDMPFDELERVETPMTLYAATKKANESMGHSYAHLWNLPTTMFRFFTVYGPWGRPDMALFKFTKGILNGEPIDIYNHGEMYRDFTYVTDVVRGMRLLIDAAPVRPTAVTTFRKATASRRSRRSGWSISATATRSACSTSSKRSKRNAGSRPSATTWTCRRATCPRPGPMPTC